MALATFEIFLDLDGSGAYATDIAAKAKKDSGFDVVGRGRVDELDQAGETQCIVRLANASGDFSPRNAGGAYYPDFATYKLTKEQITYNSVVYDWFTGIIKEITIDPEIDEQLATFTASDLFFLLSRTEVRRPLMRDAFTGVILNRLVDDVEGAEGREAVANPRFETNTTGWSAQSGATITRMTTGVERALILEGPASLQVITGATGYPRYTFPENLAGLKYTATVYVKPEEDADIGDQVRIVLADNIGGPAGAFVALDNRDQWKRISITRTFDAASTSQWLQIESIAGNISYRIGAAHAVPFVNAIPRAVDWGQTILPYFAEYRGKAHEAIERVRREEGLALVHFNGAGTFVFEDRHHRFRETHSTVSQNTFNLASVPQPNVGLKYSEHGDDRIKSVHVDYVVHVLGTPGTVLASKERVYTIPSGVTIPVEFDYEGGAAVDVIPPVANSDYFLLDGAGVDQSGSATVTFEDQGTGGKMLISQSIGRPCYLRSAQVRGTPIRVEVDTAHYTDASGPDLASEKTIQLNYAGETLAAALAEYIGRRYAGQQERIEATIIAPLETPSNPVRTDMVAALARVMSDRVTLVNTSQDFSTHVNGDYYIERIDLNVDGHAIIVRWGLTPAESYYVIGDTLTGSEVMAP